MASNITVILPIHELQDNLKDYLPNAINSVASQQTLPDELLIVRSNNKKLKTFLDKFDFGSLKDITKVIENKTGNFDFASQINYGVSECNTKYFTFLEFDDELSQIWIKNSVKYIDAYPEVGVFLPIIFECDPNGQFISFSNENVWGKNVSEEMGFVDNNTLQKLHNFNFDGMVVNKEMFEESGGLKSNMKLH